MPGMPGMPGAPGGMPAYKAPVVNLIKLTSPELKPSINLKPFVIKRVILDRENDC
jgi:hypothetical protein